MIQDSIYESAQSAERAFIGRLILYPKEFHDHDLRSEEIYDPVYRRLHQAMEKIWETGSAPDVVTLEDWTRNNPGPEISAEKMMLLSSAPVLSFNMANLAALIRDAALDRRTRLIAEGIVKSELHGKDLLGGAMHAFNNVSHADEKGWVPIGQVAATVLEKAEARERGEKGDEITTGIKELDDFGLLELGGILAIGARTSMGKTALAQYLTEQWAEQGESVGVFSTETTQYRLGKRYIARSSGINSRDIGRAGPSSARTWRAMVAAAAHLNGLGIFIDDHSMRRDTIVRAIRRGRQQHGLSIIVLDYLQRCIRGAEPRKEINQLLSAVIETCRSYDPPISMVFLSQLGRSVEKQADKKPQMSDLLESGQIEADADVVVFPFRPYYYGQRGVEMYKDADPSELYLDRAKARDDSIFGLSMVWDHIRGQIIGPKPGPSERPTQEDLL